MKERKVEIISGVGFLDLLGLLFIFLKITGFIDWSWWWVLLPIYGPWMLVAVVLLLLLIYAMIVNLINR